MSLFAASERRHLEQAQPLAARMRPRDFAEFRGQLHLVQPGSPLRNLLEAKRFGSLILFGPPGSGKTTLARLLAQETQGTLVQWNAISTGVREIRGVLDQARDQVASGGAPHVLFIDELHRFHRGQQEILLREIEEGIVRFVGATTANPYFALSSALLSRSQVFELHPLSEDDLRAILDQACVDVERGLGGFRLRLHEGACESLIQWCEGDARRALQLLEWSAMAADPRAGERSITAELVAQVAGRRGPAHDRDGDSHYDLISALIKSIRGSDPDAGMYWLARMLEAGEDVRYLGRRLLILASEDIGNADPQALLVATAAMQACEFVGLPECQFALAQAVTYLACAPKSNAATVALAEARRDVREGVHLSVPLPLRDAHAPSASARGHGVGYRSPHEAPEGLVPQMHWGARREYYRPVPRGFELELGRRLERIRGILRGEFEVTADED